MLIVNYVPMAFWKLFQKCAVNMGSLSDTIKTNTPCSWTISQIYNRQNSSNVKVIHTARKCADLVSRSTITHTTPCLRCVHGKWVTKSIVTCSHFHLEPYWLLMLSLYLLTCETSFNKISNVSLHPAPIILATKISVHLRATWMHSKTRAVKHPEDFLS